MRLPTRSICGATRAGASGTSRPAVVLWITVDQLRGDMPDQYLPAAAKGGFRLLARRGVSVTNAHCRHAMVLMES